MTEELRPIEDIKMAERAIGFTIDAAEQETPGSITDALSLGLRGVELLMQLSHLRGLRAGLGFDLGEDNLIIGFAVDQFRFALRPSLNQQTDLSEAVGADPLGK